MKDYFYAKYCNFTSYRATIYLPGCLYVVRIKILTVLLMLLAAICRKFFYSFVVPADYQRIEKICSVGGN